MPYTCMHKGAVVLRGHPDLNDTAELLTACVLSSTSTVHDRSGNANPPVMIALYMPMQLPPSLPKHMHHDHHIHAHI